MENFVGERNATQVVKTDEHSNFTNCSRFNGGKNISTNCFYLNHCLFQDYAIRKSITAHSIGVS